MTVARHICRWSFMLVLWSATCTVSSAQIFTGSDDGPTANPAVHKDPAVQQTAWPSIPLPKITMPKVSMPDMSLITTPVKAGFGKITSGTKKAWEGTKEIFTFGKGDSNPSAGPQDSQPKKSFWGKIFSSEPEPQDGPQTVGEWMSQPRLDP